MSHGKKDDLRDKAEGRESVFEIFKKSLIDNKKTIYNAIGRQSLRLKNAPIIEDLRKAKEMELSQVILFKSMNVEFH
jgi:hypothetical protein